MAGSANTLTGGATFDTPVATPNMQPATTPSSAPPNADTTGGVNIPGLGPCRQNPDGTITPLTGPYAGKSIGAKPIGGGSQVGGFDAGTYAVNPDGSITIITNGNAGGKDNVAGKTVTPNGQFLNPDGTPFAPGGEQVWAARGANGNPATDNPNFNGQGVLTNGDNTGLLDQVPGFDAAKDAATKLLTGLQNAASPGAPIDTSSADAETTRANALADALGAQAGQAGAQADVDRGLGAQTRDQQEQSIQQLQDAASGKTASPAELQLQRQSAIDAARQQGLAAALQGSNPSAALRQASMGAAKVAGDTNANAAILRATETANARTALANALSNVRQSDQGAVNTDVNQQGTLTQGQLTSQGQGVTSTGQKLTAETEKEKADAARQGALIGAGATTAATLLSDKRTKKDVAKADLADALAKGVHGVTFSYRPEAAEDAAPHFGLLADELERVVPGVVKRDPVGIKVIDTGHLTTANTSILAELARRLLELEKGKEARHGR